MSSYSAHARTNRAVVEASAPAPRRLWSSPLPGSSRPFLNRKLIERKTSAQSRSEAPLALSPAAHYLARPKPHNPLMMRSGQPSGNPDLEMMHLTGAVVPQSARNLA